MAHDPQVIPAELDPALVYTARKHAAVRTDEYLYNQLIPYIGNKRKLLWLIAEAIRRTGVVGGTFVDFFAGSSVVARLAKTLGYRVLTNDWEPYAAIINQGYVQCNTLPPFAALGGPLRPLPCSTGTLSRATWRGTSARRTTPSPTSPPSGCSSPMPTAARSTQCANRSGAGNRPGWSATMNGRCCWRRWSTRSATPATPVAYSRASIAGWGGQTRTALYRILSAIELRPPVLHDNGQANRALQMDAQVLAERLRDTGEEVSIAYLDPPYNQHPYGSNYHLLNTVVLWDKPRLSPQITARTKSAIRTDWRTARRSAYNYATALAAYDALLQTIPARTILTSYSTDGNMPLDAMLDCAARRGALSVVTRPYKRYRVSAQRMSPKPINAEFVLYD